MFHVLFLTKFLVHYTTGLRIIEHCMLSVFHPINFSVIVKTGKIVCDLIPTVMPFCERYYLDFIKCAEELLCFSWVYSQLFCALPINVLEYEDDAIEAEENENIEEIEEKDPDESSQSTNNASSFTTALHILCNETYHLKDAFPELCNVYGIICTIPISSCTAERSFSAYCMVFWKSAVNIQQNTILRCWMSLGWTFCGSAYCQLICDVNKQKRLEWAQQWANDTFDDVIWTDECTVQLTYCTFNFWLFSLVLNIQPYHVC